MRAEFTNQLLPIGTVVKLKGLDKLFMIYGLLQQNKVYRDTVFDYISVPYPEGQIDSSINYGFFHKDIEQVVFRGYEDTEGERSALLKAITWAVAKGETDIDDN